MRMLVVLGMAAALCAVAHGAEKEKGRIAYSRQDGDRITIHLMNADGTGDAELPGQTAKNNIFPTWSPDGKRLGYMTTQQELGFEAVVVNIDGTAPMKLMGPARLNGLPVWSPDGKQFAFVSGVEQPSVFVADENGANARQVNPQGTAGLFPFWSHDGKKIGYTEFSQEEKGEVMLVDAGGGAPEKLTGSGVLAIAGPNALSPDGKRLAYVAADRGTKKGSLRIFDLATKGEVTVVELDMGYAGDFPQTPIPAWTPDGKELIVPVAGEKGRGLYRITEEGKKTRLTPEGIDCFGGAWFEKR